MEKRVFRGECVTPQGVPGLLGFDKTQSKAWNELLERKPQMLVDPVTNMVISRGQPVLMFWDKKLGMRFTTEGETIPAEIDNPVVYQSSHATLQWKTKMLVSMKAQRCSQHASQTVAVAHPVFAF